jgi:hypothetical protein
MRAAVISLAVLLAMSCASQGVPRAPTLQLHLSQVAEGTRDTQSASQNKWHLQHH